MTARLNGLVYGSVALAACALALSAWQLFGGPGASNVPCACEDLPARVAALEGKAATTEAKQPTLALARALERLRERVEALESRGGPPSTGSGGASGTGEGDPAVKTPIDGSPHYVRFIVSQPGLAVRQLDNGSLAVKNSDPSLTNSQVLITAIDDNGEERLVTVTVPAPE